MKKSIFFSLMFSGLLIAAAFFVVSSHRVLAVGEQGPPTAPDSGLVQCGRLGVGQPFCDMCDLIVLVQNFLNFIWKAAWVLAAAMMVYGGFYMILPSFGAGGSGMFEKGKKILTNVAWGLVIVFFAWIMIDTIIKVVAGGVVGSTAPAGLFTGSQSFGPWNKISCTRAPDRAPLALLEIPEALRCPPGVTSKMVGTVDVCAPLVVQAFQTDSSLKGAARGQCSPSSIAGLDKPNSCGTQSCGSLIDSIAGSDAKLMRAIVLVESSGSPGAISPKGACGIAQVLPTTAKKSCTELLDARTGISEGLKVIQELRRDSRVGGNVRRVLIGYNGGPRALEQSDCAAGVVKGECTTKPGGYAETINYFQKVESCLGSL